MADLRNCPECGKVFVKISKNLCPDCIEKEEREFEDVRLYLKDSPNASIEEIVEITGVEEKKVLRWMREGRVDVSYADGASGLTCKSCGAAIRTGNLCSRCAKSLSAQMRSASQQTPVGKSTVREEEEPARDKKKGMYSVTRDD